MENSPSTARTRLDSTGGGAVGWEKGGFASNMAGGTRSTQSDFLGQYCRAMITDTAPARTQMLANFCEHSINKNSSVLWQR